MSLLFIVLAIAFTAWMTVWMVLPFARSRHRQINYEMLDEELRQIESLVSRKVALVQALRDIEYDFKTNKISQEDYQRFKTSCERQAVGVMRRLDELHGGTDDWDPVIDEAIEQRLEGVTDDVVEGDLDSESARWSDEEAGELVCQSCDVGLDAGDRFCSQCGEPVDDASPKLGTSDDFQSLSSPPRTSEVAG